MKKILFTLVFCCLMGASTSFAQKVNGVALKDLPGDYIEMSEYPLVSTQYRIAIDYGQKPDVWSSSFLILKDNEDKDMLFNSMIDALNFMSKNGYELANTYTIKTGDVTKVYYILKKKKS